MLLLVYTVCVYAQIEDKHYTPFFLFENKSEIPFYILPDVDTKKLLREDRKNEDNGEKKLRYASLLDVEISPGDKGEWHILENGDRIWILKIVSPGAYSLGVLFERYHLPEGARLFIYNSNKKHIRGAFTSKNNKSSNILAIAPVKGDEIVLEYYEPKDVKFKGELLISSIAHDYKNIFNYLEQSKGYGQSGECNVNINCSAGDDWQTIKQAVCKITFFGYSCTGTLINNTKQDGHPYFLTANHCIDNSSSATAAIFYFNYESSTCNNALPLVDQTISGSNLIATPSDNSLDYCLLELSTAPPSSYNPYYAGWNRDVTDPDTVTSIHHPRGDIKKISVSDSSITTGNYKDDYVEFSHWWIKKWGLGTTEKGSSGAPLFNKEGLIIGDLSGGTANCDLPYNDYFAQFHRSWNEYELPDQQLKKWLDPDSTGVISLIGFKPYDTIPSNLRFKLTDTIVTLLWNEIIDTANCNYYKIYKNDKFYDSTETSFYYDTLYNDSVNKYFVRAALKEPVGFETEKSNTVYVRPMQSLTIPFHENFEGQTDLSFQWYEEKSNEKVGWVFRSGREDGFLDTAYEGSVNAYFHSKGNDISRLVLPKFDFSSNTNVLLSFYLHNEAFLGNNHKLNILYKEADSLSWKTIRIFDNEFSFWKKVNIPLINLSDQYQIALEAIGAGGYGICIDSILLIEDGKHIYPEIYADKDTICIVDSINFSTNIDDSYLLEWNFGDNAIPQEAFGPGPHNVHYIQAGIKSVILMVDETYIKQSCDIAVVYDMPKPSFTSNGNMLTSNYRYGNQWYLDGELIPDAVNQSYSIEEDGEYFVEVTNPNNCVGFSESQLLIVNDIEIINDEIKFNGIEVYPNPNSGCFVIRVNRDKYYNELNYNIIDLTGRTIYSGLIEKFQYEENIALPKINDGIYIIRISNGNYYCSFKMIIKK